MSKLQGRNLVGLFVALTLAAGSASATNGYYTTGTGTKSKGQAGAGSANPQELMSLATNPAGIAFLDEAIEAGLGIFSPMRDYKTTPSQAPGACFAPGQCLLTVGPNDLSSENEFFPIPYVGMNWKLTDVDNLALAFYARGGMNTKWVGGTVTYDPYFGMNPGVTTPVTLPGTFGDGTAGVDLMQGFLNLTYARKISDQFSVGASAIFALQRFEARGLDNFAPFTRTYVSTFNPATGGQAPRNLSDNSDKGSLRDLNGFAWTGKLPAKLPAPAPAMDAIGAAKNYLQGKDVKFQEKALFEGIQHPDDQAHLVWYPSNGKLVLAYEIDMHPNVMDHWTLFVEATTFEVLEAYSELCAIAPLQFYDLSSFKDCKEEAVHAKGFEMDEMPAVIADGVPCPVRESGHQQVFAEP